MTLNTPFTQNDLDALSPAVDRLPFEDRGRFRALFEAFRFSLEEGTEDKLDDARESVEELVKEAVAVKAVVDDVVGRIVKGESRLTRGLFDELTGNVYERLAEVESRANELRDTLKD